MKPKHLAILALVVAQIPVWAFQLSPVGTAAERKFAKRWGASIRTEITLSAAATHKFSSPVHEALTQKIFGCDGDWSACEDPDLEYAGPFVIAGVRWNDDPVFVLSPGEAAKLPCNTQDTVSFVTQTRCWIGLFRDAEKKAATDGAYFLKPGRGSYLARSHFGDLQFLHAMASQGGEPASVTKARILMWAQFTWGVIQGNYQLDTPLKEIPIEGWKTHFSNGQTVQDLFTVGRPWLRPHVKEVALGSLLHLVQDSFAQGHVDRAEPLTGSTCMGGSTAQFGRIKEFHSYAQQDHGKHKEADSSDSARKHISLMDPDVLNAGQRLRQYRDHQAQWAEVLPYLSECVFVLEDELAPASAGGHFAQTED